MNLTLCDTALLASVRNLRGTSLRIARRTRRHLGPRNTIHRPGISLRHDSAQRRMAELVFALSAARIALNVGTFEWWGAGSEDTDL